MRTKNLATTLLLAVALAACGGSDSNDPTGDGGSGGSGGTGGSGGVGGAGGSACPDDDADGVCNDDDQCPAGDDGADADEDGVADACDNCPEVANADQADTDGIAAVRIPFGREAEGGNVLSIERYFTSAMIPIGFDFDFFGSTRDQVKIAASGFLGFSNAMAGGCCDASPIPLDEGPQMNDLVYAGWSDLYPGETSRISYELRGEAPNRRFVVTWNEMQVAVFGGHGLGAQEPVEQPAIVTTQAILFETTNAVEVHTYLARTGEDSVFTRGIENADGTVAAVLPFENGETVDFAGSAVRFTSSAEPDGIGDACASRCVDADRDSVCDDVDACLDFPDGEDQDDDGVPDGCDVCPEDAADDSDEDGSCDSVDLCMGHDDAADADGDGKPDGCDSCPGEDDRLDLDFDGVADACDLCHGDDATGDADADGTCDSNDMCAGEDDRLASCPWLPMRGGTGGGDAGYFECAAGTSAAGYELRMGRGQLVGARLICLDEFGTEASTRPGAYGSYVDTTQPWELRCDADSPGARLVGQFLTPDWILYGVGLVCRDGNGHLFTVEPERTEPRTTLDLCDGQGERVIGMNLRLGGWMDALQSKCG